MSETTERPNTGGADSHMPSGVREAAARADEMIRAMSAAQIPPAPAEGQDAGGPEGASGGTAPSSAAGGEVPQSPPAEPTPPATPPADVHAEETQALKDEIARLKQEARTWKGRYEAETPRERAGREEAEAKLAELQARVADSEKKPESTMDPLSEEEVDRYGEDLLKIAARFVMPIVDARLARLEARFAEQFTDISGKVERTESHTAKSEWDKFTDALTKRMPTWKEIDSKETFGQWLDEIDPLFGEPRRKAVDSAAQNRDVERAARVFEAFVSQNGAKESRVAKQDKPAVPQAPTAPVDQPTSPTLAALAAPGNPSPSQQPATPGGQPGAKVWMISEIQDFYRAKGRGEYRDRAAEADRIERDIAAAQREGRVR